MTSDTPSPIKRTSPGRPPAKEIPLERPQPVSLQQLLSAYDGKGFVELMEKCHGDLTIFLSSFTTSSNHGDALAQVLQVLNQKNNELHLAKFKNLMDCFEQSQMMLMKREALNRLQGLKKNASAGKISATVSYCKIFLSHHAEGEKTKAREKAKRGDDAPDTAEVEGMMADMEAARL